VGCGARALQSVVIRALCHDLEGPFGILYVLVVSRLGRESARCQSPQLVDHEGLNAFLDRYRASREKSEA